jgi:hypothetical protein
MEFMQRLAASFFLICISLAIIFLIRKTTRDQIIETGVPLFPNYNENFRMCREQVHTCS